MKALPKDLTVDDPRNWNFDAVPDSELMACCYWEYARESAFIRDVRQRFADQKLLDSKRGKPWERLWLDWERIQSIGAVADILLRGFLLKPTTYDPNCYTLEDASPFTGSFPTPWQSVPLVERYLREKIEENPPAAFKRCGSISAAEFLLEEAKKHVEEYITAEHKLHREYPGYGGGTLRRMGKWPKLNEDCSVNWGDGTEATMVEIGWEHFTNDQIVQAFRKWVKANRPKNIPKPNKQGRKHISDRVNLERLGIMRLLRPYTLDQLREKCPPAWKLYNTKNRRWRRDAEKARARFHSLLPFLPAKDNPLSWPPKNHAQPPA